MIKKTSRYDLQGQRFDRLVVLHKQGIDKHGHVLWLCQCDCGKQIPVLGQSLVIGHTKSCGCLQKEIMALIHAKHGHCKRYKVSPEYSAWDGMIQRCFNQNSPAYNDYGSRGITVCDRWLHSFEAFLEDIGPRPSPRHSIERINNNGNYEPANCKWATPTEQARNKRRRKDNTSGVQGVGWNKNARKWQARIAVNSQKIHIGYFEKLDEAIAARQQAEKKYWNKVV